MLHSLNRCGSVLLAVKVSPLQNRTWSFFHWLLSTSNLCDEVFDHITVSYVHTGTWKEVRSQNYDYDTFHSTVQISHVFTLPSCCVFMPESNRNIREAQIYIALSLRPPGTWSPRNYLEYLLCSWETELPSYISEVDSDADSVVRFVSDWYRSSTSIG